MSSRLDQPYKYYVNTNDQNNFHIKTFDQRNKYKIKTQMFVTF